MSKRQSTAAVEERPAVDTFTVQSIDVQSITPTPANLSEEFRTIPLSRLVPSTTNPRRHFDETRIADLARSLAEKGCIEPIVVRPIDDPALDGVFEIVAGECRYRAAKQGLLSSLPAVVRPYTDEQVLEIQLEENDRRNGLTPLERARGYRRLIESNPDKHNVHTIAARVGMSPTWVWDHLKLLDLVPDAIALLEAERITYGHAVLISRLKPEHQARVIAPRRQNLSQSRVDGLWQEDHARLSFIDAELDADDKARKADPYHGLKPVSVKELETYIREHVRFDVQHAAQAQPLVFDALAARIEEKQAEPGRGKKVVHITFEYRVADSARDEQERTYGTGAWKRADGREKSKPCEHAVLGLVVAGAHYGEAFEVCVARDRCRVHWKDEVAAKEKAQKLRESGKSKQAAKVEQKAEEKQADKWERERRETEERRRAWGAIEEPILADAVAQARQVRVLTPAQARALEKAYDIDISKAKDLLGAMWFKTPAAALLVAMIGAFGMATYNTKTSGFDQFVAEIAKPFGLSIKKLEAVRDQHQQPQASATPAKAKKGGKRS